MNHAADSIPSPLVQPLPAPDLDPPTPLHPDAAGDAAPAIEPILARLLREESSLYMIVREWRFDAEGRKFLRLHALLNEQFSEIGLRLARLATHSRALGGRGLASQAEQASVPSIPAAGGALEPHMIRELLALHEAMSRSLRRAGATVADSFNDRATTDLLAELNATHEKDAFVLRALLWEVENISA